ncbi:MAG: hypothetical protein LBJ23_00900 [Tannerella sp.]|nr:hypothetical protein [Tannerella sp.]
MRIVLVIVFSVVCRAVPAQEAVRAEVGDSLVPRPALTLGGYGEVAYTRNFYSGSPFRYMKPESQKDAPGHGRFDMPHVVFFAGYDFGRGWRMSSEIEFEHGGTESAMEVEAEEGGEYEQEVERGGEVVLEQFWIEKTISRGLNIRAGHLIVPVGLTNGNHLPTQFFTVYRPEGERTILPCTWHETGISLWGRLGAWRYEAMLLPALDSELFGSDRWIGNASASPYEFRIANRYAGALRVDNYSAPGLRMGVSVYYGESFRNSLMPSYAEKYDRVKGAVSIGSFDFEYRGRALTARGYFDYGHLSDAMNIYAYNRSLPNQSPSPRTAVASAALASGVEAGYDVFTFVPALAARHAGMYLFGRYEYYDSMYETPGGMPDEKWCARQRIVVGLNYFPTGDVVVKAEYGVSLLEAPFNHEPGLSIGIAYAGFFTR